MHYFNMQYPEWFFFYFIGSMVWALYQPIIQDMFFLAVGVCSMIAFGHLVRRISRRKRRLRGFASQPGRKFRLFEIKGAP